MDITVLISTSPIKSHPSTRVIDECIKSIRERLPDSRIIIMADGIREEQKDRITDYNNYLNTLTSKYPDIKLIVSEEHKHQARMTRDSLVYVGTPLIFFVEHDMVLCENIPFEEMAELILSGRGNLVRLMFEAHILDVHSYLTLETIGNYTKTLQWSQRPHLAGTDFYKMILKDYFSENSNTFIEDRIHGFISEAPWEQFKLWVYTPEGDNKRCYTIDGREDDPKYDDRLIF